MYDCCTIQGESTLVRVATLFGCYAILQRLLVASQHRLRLFYPFNQTVIYRAIPKYENRRLPQMEASCFNVILQRQESLLLSMSK